ncbi:MAG: hypothetical protein KDC92_07540, partial [Bacteroidetes bacterium]|nr:hypothetical protein [Bacteroidota bacterium]
MSNITYHFNGNTTQLIKKIQDQDALNIESLGNYEFKVRAETSPGTFYPFRMYTVLRIIEPTNSNCNVIFKNPIRPEHYFIAISFLIFTIASLISFQAIALVIIAFLWVFTQVMFLL